MVKLYRWGQASVKKHLSLSCSAVLIEYNIVIRAQPSVKISHLPLTSWVAVSDLQPIFPEVGRAKKKEISVLKPVLIRKTETTPSNRKNLRRKWMEQVLETGEALRAESASDRHYHLG